MHLSVQCPECKASLKAKTEAVGRQLLCPKCGEAILVRDQRDSSDELLLEVVDEPADLQLGGTATNDINLSDGTSRELALNSSSRGSAALQTHPAADIPTEKKPNRLLRFACFAGGSALVIVLILGLMGDAFWPFSTSDRRKGVQKQLTNAGGQAEFKAVPTADEQGLDTLDRLKAATVFIRLISRHSVQTGSGFLLEADGGKGIVVTNAHVVTTEDVVGPAEIRCVFYSGTPKEFEVNAKVSGKDDGGDLALLTVNHHSLPAPVVSHKEVELRETSPVMILGFPFGDSMKTNSRNPAISVSKASISSIRRDEHGNIAVLQVDGGINPGNSGGPMVSERGELVGISVAKVINADIGFAIPKRMLMDAVAGQVIGIGVRELGRLREGRHFSVKVEFIDPKKNITSATLATFRSANQTAKYPELGGHWKVAYERPEESQSLSINSSAASARLIIPASSTDMLFQVHWERSDGTRGASAPIQLGEAGDAPSASAAGNLPSNGLSGRGGVLLLSNTMAEFALNPRTGDIAAVDPISKRVFLLQQSLLENENTDSAPEIRLNGKPVSITYKKFEDLEIFAVVCLKKSTMYIIDAINLALLHEVPVQNVETGSIWRVVASPNPKDPFVYYDYNAGKGAATGVVDLRKMADRGLLMMGTFDVLSPDGRTAYPASRFESYGMVNDFDDTVPEFVAQFSNHRRGGPYLPGPFGNYTTSGSEVHTSDLERQVATLAFVPSSFFRTKPVLVGYDVMSKGLRAASYNTFESVGDIVPLPVAVTEGANILSDPGALDIKLNVRVLADDKNSRVIYAFRNKLALVPLSSFNLPDEPFMVLDKTRFELTVGRNKPVEITPTDPRITVEYGDLPIGARSTATGLEWVPQNQDLGVTVVPLTLAFNDIRRETSLNLSVTQPHVDAPFENEGLMVDDSASMAVVWTGVPRDDRGRPVTDAEPKCEIAIVPLRAGASVVRKSLPFNVKQALIVGNRLAILPTTQKSRVEIYDIATLDRAQTLLAQSPIVGISATDSQLFLRTSTGVDVYDNSSFERLRIFNSMPNEVTKGTQKGMEAILEDGIIVDGFLLDMESEKPKLALTPRGFPTLNGGVYALFSGTFLRRQQTQQPLNISTNEGTHIVGGPMLMPERGVRVLLEQSATITKASGSLFTWRLKHQLSLLIQDANGSLLDRVPIVNETERLNSKENLHIPSLMQVVGDKVFVSSGGRIFRWVAKDYGRGASLADAPQEFYIVPEQSKLYSPAEITELTHQVKGGQQPIEYLLLSQVDGVTIDPHTGIATIERGQVLADAAAILKKLVPDATVESDIALELQTASIKMIQPAIQIIGHKPSGFLMAVPLHFKAVDNRGKVAEMQYFVFLDVPFDQAAKVLTQNLHETQAKK